MILVFGLVLVKSRTTDDYAEIQPRASRIRTSLFWVLLVGFALATAITLRHMPYRVATALADPIVVEVTGHQWYWEMSRVEVPAQRPIVFRVGSADVNHGFGVYDPDLRLIGQVQAMPGYVNELALRFDKPGTYTIRCLEYCGVVHHAMLAPLQVTGNASTAEEM